VARQSIRLCILVRAQLLPLVDLVLGLALLTTIGFVAMRSPLTAHAPGRRLVGWLLVALPLPIVVASSLLMPSSPLGGEAAFVFGVLAFAIGVVLLLSGGGDAKDEGGEADLDPAPWWPDFERQFRAYARRQSRRRVTV
jgi:hypothetical protein